MNIINTLDKHDSVRMVYGLVKGSNFALLLAVAQAFAWVKTLVDGLSIDMSTRR
jgi:hypothetical protein